MVSTAGLLLSSTCTLHVLLQELLYLLLLLILLPTNPHHQHQQQEYKAIYTKTHIRPQKQRQQLQQQQTPFNNTITILLQKIVSCNNNMLPLPLLQCE